MGFIFFLIITPIGLFMRLGKDLLNLNIITIKPIGLNDLRILIQ